MTTAPREKQRTSHVTLVTGVGPGEAYRCLDGGFESGQSRQSDRQSARRCQITRLTRERVIVLICADANYGSWRSRNL